MPTLNWIGKEAVVNHHQHVPFHLLKDVPDPACGDPGSGNLIVQGDNLVALKALLPYYAGQVKCIYIDPPYNTGNEGWAYNDNVNSPVIRKWLGEVVGKEGETLDRHDRWLCMMYPRLVLLRKFLRVDGAIFVSLDDNEIGSLRLVMDEVFGASNFATTFIWEKRTTRENRRVFSFSHDFVLCYAKNLDAFEAVRGTLPLTEEVKGRYVNPDNDPRGQWQSISLNAQAGHGTPAQFYKIVTPGGRELAPPPGTCWRVTKPRFEEMVADNRIYFGPKGTNAPRIKKFLSESAKGLTPHTLWRANEVGTTDSGTKSLMEIFNGEARFDSPKPIDLIERIIRIATLPGDLILDSFAGSGTTGHAVLKLNAANAVPATQEAVGSPSGFGLRQPSGAFPSPIGIHRGRAVCLLYNGILKDKSPDGGNALTQSTLALLREACAGESVDRLVVYGTSQRLSPARLKRENVDFKQIPYHIRTT